MLHVVAATPLYPPDSRVGAWLATHSFLAHLTSRGHTVTVHTKLSSHRYQLDGVNIVGRQPLDLSNAAVVVSHLGDDGAAHKAALKAGIPSVRMVHGHTSGAAFRLHGASLAVFNSQAMADDVDWDGPSIICHPPTFPDRYRTTPGDRYTLVNPTSDKGGELIQLLAAMSPQLRFLTVAGFYGRQIRRPAPNVLHIPPTHQMRDDVYSRTRVLLMPSLHETWGMVGVEAMASGIPVIAHPTPGLVESLGHAGIFADRRDLRAWQHEIERLADPIEWETASTRARERSAQLDPLDSLTRYAHAIEQFA